MSYINAINKIKEDLEREKLRLSSNSLTRPLTNPKGRMNLALGTAGLTAAGLLARNAELPVSVKEAIGGSLLLTLPLRGISNSISQKTTTAENRAQFEAAKMGRATKFADVLQPLITASKVSSSSLTDLRSALIAASVLMPSNPLLHTAATGALVARGLTHGPLAATSMAAALAPNLIGQHLLGLSAVAAKKAAGQSPYTAAMAMGPAILGHMTGFGLHAAGGAANLLGFGGAGNFLNSAGTFASAKGTALTAAAMSNPMLAIALGMGTMMLGGKIKGKIENWISENAAGTSLLKKGSATRPRKIAGSQLEQRYSETTFLDQQVQMLGNAGQLQTGEWLQLTYLGAIAKHTSLLRFMAETIQDMSGHNKNVGGNITQNNLQHLFGHTGYRGTDLTNFNPESHFLNKKIISWVDAKNLKYKKVFNSYNPRDLISSLDPLGDIAVGSARLSQNALTFLARTLLGGAQYISDSQYRQQQNNLLSKKLTGVVRGLDIAGAAIDPMAWLLGGEHSAFGKYKKYKEEDLFKKSLEKASKITGIPNNFLTVLETTSTTLMDKGQSPEEKMIALLAGSFEVQRFIGFKVQDIASKMGITPEESSMGVTGYIKQYIEENQDKQRGLALLGKNLATSKIPGLMGASLGFMTGGPLGALMGAGMISNGLQALAGFAEWRGRKKGEIRTADELAEEAAPDIYFSETTKGNQYSKLIPQIYKTPNVDEDQLDLIKERKTKKEQQEIARIDLNLNYLATYFKKQSPFEYLKSIDKKLASLIKIDRKCCNAGSGKGLADTMLEAVGAFEILSKTFSGIKTGIVAAASAITRFFPLIGLATGVVTISEYTKEKFEKAKEEYKPTHEHSKKQAEYRDKNIRMPRILGNLLHRWHHLKNEKEKAKLAKNISFQVKKAHKMGVEVPRELQKIAEDYDNGRYDPYTLPINPAQDLKITIPSKSISTFSSLKEQQKLEKAEKYYNEKAKEFAGMGGDKNKIDTQEELAALLNAIREDQQVVGKMSIEQQKGIMELLSQNVKAILHSNGQVTQALQEIKKIFIESNTLSHPGNN